MKLYRLIFSSYTDEDGWISWIGTDVWTDKSIIDIEAMKHDSEFLRCQVEEFESK